MPCTTDYIGLWTDLSFVDAVRCPFQNTLGPAFPMLAILAIGLAYLVLSGGRPVLPLVALVIVGSTVMFLLPGSAVTAVVALAVLVMAATGYLLYRRVSGVQV